MAGERTENFKRNIEKAAFRLELHTDGKGREAIRWHLKRDDKAIVYSSDPYVGIWKKIGVVIIKLLPVESQLGGNAK